MEGMIEVNGVNLWHRITGDGVPVVQIHGAGFGHFNFDPATPELSKHFRVVDYDMRGYGQSDRPVQDYDMEVWADDLAGLMDALEIDEAHVHGTSMGGMIAIVFAGKYPRAHDVRRDQLRGCEARRHRTPDLQELDRHRAPGSGRSRQPPARRADHVAGPLEALPRGAGRDRARRI